MCKPLPVLLLTLVLVSSPRANSRDWSIDCEVFAPGPGWRLIVDSSGEYSALHRYPSRSQACRGRLNSEDVLEIEKAVADVFELPVRESLRTGETARPGCFDDSTYKITAWPMPPGPSQRKEYSRRLSASPMCNPSHIEEEWSRLGRLLAEVVIEQLSLCGDPYGVQP